MNNLRFKILRAKLLRVLRQIDVKGDFRKFIRNVIVKITGEKPAPPGVLIESADVVDFDWPELVKKPRVGLVIDFGIYASSPKYERFLKILEFMLPLQNMSVSSSTIRYRLSITMSKNQTLSRELRILI